MLRTLIIVYACNMENILRMKDCKCFVKLYISLDYYYYYTFIFIFTDGIRLFIQKLKKTVCDFVNKHKKYTDIEI